MAEFCLQCGMELFFGPYSDFKGLSTARDTANGLYPLVLCEGCGPCQVDHRGVCIGGCYIDSHTPPGSEEVLRSATEWLDRRSGPLGLFLRLYDRVFGTPWDQGWIHDSEFAFGVINIWQRLVSGNTVAHEVLWNREYLRLNPPNPEHFKFYDLDAGVKFLYPVLTPLKGEVPRKFYD